MMRSFASVFCRSLAALCIVLPWRLSAEQQTPPRHKLTVELLRTLQHDEEIRQVKTVAISPDGRLIATGGYERLVRLWDTATGEIKHAFENELPAIESVAFSPDGKAIACAQQHGVVNVFDIASGAKRHRLQPQPIPYFVQSIAFSPDGKWLALAGSVQRDGKPQGEAQLWDVETGQLKRTFAAGYSYLSSVAFSPDGKTLATSGGIFEGNKLSGGGVALWGVETGDLRFTLSIPEKSHGNGATAFSPDGNMLASTHFDRGVRLWNPQTGELVRTLSGGAMGVRFFPDGKTLVGVTDGVGLRFWDVTSGNALHQMQGHSASIWDVAVSRDGKTVASASADKTVKVWSVARTELPPRPPLADHAGRMVFCSNRDGDNFEIYTMNADGHNIRRLTHDDCTSFWPVLSPDGKQIAFSKRRLYGDVINEDVFVMNDDGSNLRRLTTDPADDTTPFWSPDGKRIVFVRVQANKARIWVMDADGSNQVCLTPNSTGGSPAWSPDGMKIAFGSSRQGNMDIYVMDADGSNAINLTKNPALDWLPAWSPDGKQIAFASDRGGQRNIWIMNADGSEPKQLTNIKAREGMPRFSPDGKRIVFHSNRTGNEQDFDLFTMKVDGSDVVNLTEHFAFDQMPHWGK